MILRCDWARFYCELLVARVKVGCHSEYDFCCGKNPMRSRRWRASPFATCTTRRHAAIKLAERPPVAGFGPEVFTKGFPLAVAAPKVRFHSTGP